MSHGSAARCVVAGTDRTSGELVYVTLWNGLWSSDWSIDVHQGKKLLREERLPGTQYKHLPEVLAASKFDERYQGCGREVVVPQERQYTVVCGEVPAWDEHYVILPGTYPLEGRHYNRGYPYEEAVVKARVVYAKKAALWGGVAVGKARGPEAGGVVELYVPLDQLTYAADGVGCEVKGGRFLE